MFKFFTHLYIKECFIESCFTHLITGIDDQKNTNISHFSLILLTDNQIKIILTK